MKTQSQHIRHPQGYAADAVRNIIVAFVFFLVIVGSMISCALSVFP